MSEQEPHKIDETFRSMIERMSFTAPPANLDGMRANVLQLQLGRLQTENNWLKATLGIAVLLLGSSGYLLLKGKPPTSVRQAPIAQQIITVRQTDTVYITRTKRVYVYSKRLNKSNSNSNFEPLSNEETTTLSSNLTKEKTNEIEESTNLGTDKRGIIKNDQPQHLRNDHRKTAQNQSQQILNNNINGLNRTDNTKNQSDFETGELASNENKQIKELKSSMETSPNTEAKITNIEYLTPLSYSLDPQLKMPSVRYKTKNQSIIKYRTPRDSFVKRLSIGAYYAPEWNQLNLRRDEVQAFEYGREEIKNSQVVGLRTSIKLSNHLTLLTGITHQTINFEHKDSQKESLMAEEIDGHLTFIHRTAFGTTQIPTEQITSKIEVGSKISVEGDDDNFAQYWQIPLALRYDFYNQKYALFEKRKVGLNLYALGGGYWAIPTKQQMKVEVYEPNGHEFHEILTHFQNIQPNFGLTIGLGAEISYGQHWHVFGEPYYQTSISSLVKDMSLRTFIGGAGLRFGLRYQLKEIK